jgi:hypothetical protein
VLALQPCVLGQFGAIRGEGRSSALITETHVQWKSWIALGPGLRLLRRLNPFAGLEATLGLPLTITRPEFRFAHPDIPLHRVPSATFSAMVAVAVRP